ncbi:MAG: hypothetical protein Q4F60_02505 [Candidatus Saccharibacteria bacterium]|nr:hypothetical protein [Candidatus Saccharibacteria bacterium]
MDTSLIFLLLSILIVGVLVFIAVNISINKNHKFDREKYQTKFLKLENGLSRDNPASFSVSIIEADKLLDRAMMELGISGNTMGDRLKNSGTRFSQLNSVWYAHKTRNQIAHEPDFQVDYNKARHALATYKQALKDLGAI